MPEQDDPKDTFAIPSLPASKLVTSQKPPRPPSSKASTPKEEEPESTTIQPPPLNYTPPPWSSPPPSHTTHRFQVLKTGTHIGTIPLPSTKDFLLIGRLPPPHVDLVLDHPSISRYHAVLQFRDDGAMFLYDLGSGYGCFVNKNRVEGFVKVENGMHVRFGESSRVYVYEVDSIQEEVEQGHEIEQEQEPEQSPYATRYTSDPKTFLRKYLSLQDEELLYEVEEISQEYTVRVRVPYNSTFIIGQGSGGQKRLAEREACLDACTKLDSLGAFKEAFGGGDSEHVRLKKLLKEMDGGGDDEEDGYFDRTEKKRKPDSKQDRPQTIGSLQTRRDEIIAVLEPLRTRYEGLMKDVNGSGVDDLDELDAYMKRLEQRKARELAEGVRKEIRELERELERLEKLIKVAMPSKSVLEFQSLQKKEEVVKKLEPEFKAPSPVKRLREPSPSPEFKAPLPPSSPKKQEPVVKKPRVFAPTMPPTYRRDMTEEIEKIATEDPETDASSIVECVHGAGKVSEDDIKKMNQAYGY